MTHKLTLTFGALRLLTNYLGIPGTCTGIKEIFLGGQLLATLPETVIPPALISTPLTNPDTKALWATTISFDLEEPERDLCKKVLTTLAEKKIQGVELPASPQLNELIVKLGLVDEPVKTGPLPPPAKAIGVPVKS